MTINIQNYVLYKTCPLKCMNNSISDDRMMDMSQSLFIALSWVSIKDKRQIIDITQHNNNLDLPPSLMM